MSTGGRGGENNVSVRQSIHHSITADCSERRTAAQLADCL